MPDQPDQISEPDWMPVSTEHRPTRSEARPAAGTYCASCGTPWPCRHAPRQPDPPAPADEARIAEIRRRWEAWQPRAAPMSEERSLELRDLSLKMPWDVGNLLAALDARTAERDAERQAREAAEGRNERLEDLTAAARNAVITHWFWCQCGLCRALAALDPPT